jgi:hypothetical protein
MHLSEGASPFLHLRDTLLALYCAHQEVVFGQSDFCVAVPRWRISDLCTAIFLRQLPFMFKVKKDEEAGLQT